MEAFEHLDKHKRIGVPREWGKARYAELTKIVDSTTRPYCKWPEVQFPEGKSWWTGQNEAVELICRQFEGGGNGGRLEAPCGAGKTLIALGVASLLNTRTLVVTHKNDLSKQWEVQGEWFPGLSVGRVQQDECDFEGKHLVTAMAPTLWSRRDSLPAAFWKAFGLVVFDEGHRYPARTFLHSLRGFTARFRLGISATWRRSDGLEDLWHYHVGPIIARCKPPRLSGAYVQPTWSTFFEDRMFKRPWERFVNRQRLVKAICENISYNEWLILQAEKAHAAGRTILFVTDRVDHAKSLRQDIAKRLKDIVPGLYIGEASKDQREAAKLQPIIIATYSMMAEGTDIKELDTLILCTPRVDVEQVVGRIQRVADGKRPLLVVDPVFNTPYNERMAQKRRAVYKKIGFEKLNPKDESDD